MRTNTTSERSTSQVVNGSVGRVALAARQKCVKGIYIHGSVVCGQIDAKAASVEH